MKHLFLLMRGGGEGICSFDIIKIADHKIVVEYEIKH